MGPRAADEVAGFAYAEAFVLDHGQSIPPGFGGTMRYLSQVEIHACKLGRGREIA
jgi:hypothetical protein